jgi:hypothetical protein
MIRLGESATRMLGSWARPVLAELVEGFGETSNMAMLEGDRCVYVAQVPSPQSMRMFTELGRLVMLHCTGVGKAILSDLSDSEVLAIVRRTGLPRTEPPSPPPTLCWPISPASARSATPSTTASRSWVSAASLCRSMAFLSVLRSRSPALAAG